MVPAPRPTVHIVVAEDDMLVSMAIESLLLEDGYRVTVARNGQEALDVEAVDPADLLLTDLRMPRLDGNELIRQIRRSRPELPIAVMTAFSSELPREEEGRLVILWKPFVPDALLDTVRSLLQASWAAPELALAS